MFQADTRTIQAHEGKFLMQYDARCIPDHLNPPKPTGGRGEPSQGVGRGSPSTLGHIYIYIYIYKVEPPVLPTYPETWHAWTLQIRYKTIAKPMEMLYLSYTDHAQGSCHELELLFKFVKQIYNSKINISTNLDNTTQISLLGSHWLRAQVGP